MHVLQNNVSYMMNMTQNTAINKETSLEASKLYFLFKINGKSKVYFKSLQYLYSIAEIECLVNWVEKMPPVYFVSRKKYLIRKNKEFNL